MTFDKTGRILPYRKFTNTFDIETFQSGLNKMNLRGALRFFLKKTVSKWVVLQTIGNLLGIPKIICLNCKEGGEGSTKIQNVSIKDVSIMLRGGTGKAI